MGELTLTEAGITVLTGVLMGVLVNLAAEVLPAISSGRGAVTAHGRCVISGDRGCVGAIALAYPTPAVWSRPRWWAVVLASVGLQLLTRLRFGTPLSRLLVTLYSAVLLLILVIDAEHRLVLNRVLLPTALFALAVPLLRPGMALLPVVLGGLVSFAAFLLIALAGRGALGVGDVKLAGVIGLMLGYPLALKALIAGIIIAGLATLFLLAIRRIGLRSYIPYAPWLVAGVYLVMFLDPRFVQMIGG